MASAAPQDAQNRASSGFARPQLEHVRTCPAYAGNAGTGDGFRVEAASERARCARSGVVHILPAMASYTLNKAAVAHARQLIKDHKYVLKSS